MMETRVGPSYRRMVTGGESQRGKNFLAKMPGAVWGKDVQPERALFQATPSTPVFSLATNLARSLGNGEDQEAHQGNDQSAGVTRGAGTREGLVRVG
jgi:hypothetical protein